MAAKSTITTLENAEDWDQWMREMKASISEEFWPLADPEQPKSQPMPPPIRPRIQHIAPFAVAYVGLSQAHTVGHRESVPETILKIKIVNWKSKIKIHPVASHTSNLCMIMMIITMMIGCTVLYILER